MPMTPPHSLLSLTSTYPMVPTVTLIHDWCSRGYYLLGMPLKLVTIPAYTNTDESFGQL